MKRFTKYKFKRFQNQRFLMDVINYKQPNDFKFTNLLDLGNWWDRRLRNSNRGLTFRDDNKSTFDLNCVNNEYLQRNQEK